VSENRADGAHFFPSALSMATRIMAAWRDLPPHTAAPPDGGHSVTMGHHVGQHPNRLCELCVAYM
jgi:hypothetical protein